MKYVLLLLLLIAIPVTSAIAQGSDRNFGAGIIIGEPTGLSLGLWTSHNRSFAIGAAWSFDNDRNDRNNQSTQIHVDYLFHNFNIINVSTGSLPLYMGIGGRVQFGDNEKIGVRVPFGAAYHFENNPIEIFLEIVPIINLSPNSGVSGNSGLGFRYYF